MWRCLKCATGRVQEIVKPEIFWYNAPTQITLPFNIVGLVVFELFTMHWYASPRPCAGRHPFPSFSAAMRASFLADCVLIGLHRAPAPFTEGGGASAGWRASAAWT